MNLHIKILNCASQLQTEMMNVAGEDEADDSDEPPVKKAAVEEELKRHGILLGASKSC